MDELRRAPSSRGLVRTKAFGRGAEEGGGPIAILVVDCRFKQLHLLPYCRRRTLYKSIIFVKSIFKW